MGQNLKWCTFGSWGKTCPSFIGKVESISGNTAKIRYGENQLYPLEYWDMNYVMLFDTLEEAILYLLEHSSNQSSLTETRQYLNFPSEMKKIDWEDLKQRELDMIRNRRFKFNKNDNN